ncbi:MAG: DEAD/DEAH box helicase [Acidimicrobiia bacterium]|nr:DEAD/DEAH box helicase [Acidimicrobiia bacterium]
MTVDELLMAWMDDPDRADRIAHVRELPPRAAKHAELSLDPRLAEALAEAGIHDLYGHQAESIAIVRRGDNVVLVAGTASGKTLAYQIPIAESILGAASTALVLYPTKALAQDQLRSFDELGIDDVVAATYDGDTPSEQRRWVRRHANVVLTNPDMLHVGILPSHAGWGDFIAKLQFVVIDELHIMRGVFGSHVAHVLRRLRRLCAHYGSDPTFFFTSATIGNPGELAAALGGMPVEVVERDDSPLGRRLIALWNPPLDGEGVRLGSLAESADAYIDMVRAGLPTIAFSRSRKAAELIHKTARERLPQDLADHIAPYRGGYLAAERRDIEKRLFSGELAGVSATTALELGIDVGGLDGVVINTFPGTLASFRQQAGRAGRGTNDSLTVLVGGQDALDQYYMSNPDELFRRRPEAAVVNPQNPGIITDHMGCAAFELPLRPSDRIYFGDAIEELAPALVDSGAVRVRDGQMFWARRQPPAPSVGIRSSGGPPFTIGTTQGEILGTIDDGRAHSQTHRGAIYLHRGDAYIVNELDLDKREVIVAPFEGNYYTQPKEEKDLMVLGEVQRKRVGAVDAFLGRVEVESQITGYRRKAIGSGAIIETVPLDLPPRHLVTEAFWFTFDQHLFEEAGIGWRNMPGTLHAAEHTAIAMLPMFAICDRWDVGGLSTAVHADTGGAVFFIYDGYQGGAGISPIGFESAQRHLEATLDALEQCPCLSGCPSCVVSPKCGNFNDPLDKEGAAALLRVVLR